MAEKCVCSHKLRTVRDVARDLAALQCLCKSVSTCASSVWPAVADKLCRKPYGWPEGFKTGLLTPDQRKQHIPFTQVLAGEVLQQAVNLQPAQLIVFIQIQRDKEATFAAAQAKKGYFVTMEDLKPLAPHAQHTWRGHTLPCYYSKQVPPGRFLMDRARTDLLGLTQAVTVIQHAHLLVQALVALAIKKWGGLGGFMQERTRRRRASLRRKANQRRKERKDHAAGRDSRVAQASLCRTPGTSSKGKGRQTCLCTWSGMPKWSNLVSTA